MTKLEYLQDLYRRECSNVRGVDSLTHKSSIEYWRPIEERVREEYGCSLSAFLLYEHHFNEGKSVNELAIDLGVTRQSLSYLIKRLNIPARKMGEVCTDRTKEKRVLTNSKRMARMTQKERRRLSRRLSRIHLGRDGRTRPSDSTLVYQYEMAGMSSYEMADLHKVNVYTIYHWLRYS